MLVGSRGIWLSRSRCRFGFIGGTNESIIDGGTVEAGIVHHLDLALLAGGLKVLLIGSGVVGWETTLLC